MMLMTKINSSSGEHLSERLRNTVFVEMKNAFDKTGDVSRSKVYIILIRFELS